jgi:hypothetical protein
VSDWHRTHHRAGSDCGLPHYQAPRAQSIEHQYGVQVVAKGDRYEYHLNANGKDTEVIPPTRANGEGLAQAEKQLQQKVKEQESAISQKYGVQFTPAGESAGPQMRQSISPDGRQSFEPTGKDIITRDPTLKELSGIAAGLSHSDPTSHDIDGKPLRIQAFAVDPIEGVPPGGATYEAAGQEGKHPSFGTINLDPGLGDRFRATDKDSDHSDKPSLERTITHELGHRSQERMGASGPDGQDRYQTDLGWRRLTDPDGKDSGRWAMEGKDGKLYSFVDGTGTSQANPGKWWRVNDHGEPVDTKGNLLPTPQTEAQQRQLVQRNGISTEQMMDRAKVRPGSRYFINPDEMMAEGLADFRRGETARHDLLHRAADLYREAKKFDQSELDKVYRTNPDGTPRKIRLPDGTVGDATDENRRRVQEFER